MAVTALVVAATGFGCSSGAKPAASPASTSSPRPAVNAPSPSSGPSTCSAVSPGATKPGPETNPPGDIPDNQAFVAYQPPAGGYRISVPEGWGRVEQSSAAAFTDKFNSIRLEILAAPAAPTVTSAQAEVAGLAAKAPCFQAGAVSAVSRRAGPAVLVTYRADSPPDAVTGKVVHRDIERYEFWRAGTKAVVTLASPQGSDNVDPWRKVTDSFAWLP